MRPFMVMKYIGIHPTLQSKKLSPHVANRINRVACIARGLVNDREITIGR